MNWKIFLPFPLAALILGKPIHPPKIKDPLPGIETLRCEDNSALELFLQGYAYAHESPIVAKRLLSIAEQALSNCGGDTYLMRKRILELRESLKNKKAPSTKA